MATHK
jgi:DNA-directed RNA polymerase I subunit RPA1